MKKLMIIGSLLIVGALSYGAISVELNENMTKYSGSGRLPVGSVGKTIQGTTDGTLVITPTVSSGVDGNSLAFNFGDMLKESTQTLTGKYEAVILDNNNKPMKFDPSKVTSKLYQVTGTQGNWTENDKGNQVKDIQLMTSNSQKAGTLVYDLNTRNNGNIHEGTVTAQVTIDKTASAGHFSDKSVRVKVTVADSWKAGTGVGA